MLSLFGLPQVDKMDSINTPVRVCLHPVLIMLATIASLFLVSLTGLFMVCSVWRSVNHGIVRYENQNIPLATHPLHRDLALATHP